jgi:ferredoxin-thioredoxin reductase catalytic chain
MAIDDSRIQATYERLHQEAEDGGYHLNPDQTWCKGLIGGLLTNQDRHGYSACPCRLVSGDKSADLDIICPCDYRDPDLVEYGVCYCALYVSDEVLQGEKTVASIPERRPMVPVNPTGSSSSLVPANQPGSLTVWRCRVCGYLCAREHPPGVCPICKAKGERFEVFALPR